MLTVSSHRLDANGYWDQPIAKLMYLPIAEDIDLFDQNGYDLTEIEKHYASSNIAGLDSHRSHRTALKQPWFHQSSTVEGPHLNHSLLFERKGYTGAALKQLQHWARDLPLLHKIIAMRPKWGMDFSMDYVDRDGNAFELLHWEYDCFDYAEAQAIKEHIEPIILNINWELAARDFIKRKSEWHELDFFAQSDWKCNYYGIPREKFKMVIWQ